MDLRASASVVTLPAVLTRTPRTDPARDRRRLVDAILGADEPGILLLGPAGAGKTVAAAAAARASGRRVLWARLAPPFTTAADLVALAAASAAHPDPPADGATAVELAGALLQLLEDEPTVLVVDDYHECDGEECDPLVGEVLSLLPDASRMIVCSQVRPPGLVGRAATGIIRVIDADELAFTAEEAETLFAAAGQAAGAGAVACERTRGWAIGVAAAAEDFRSGGLLDSAILARLDREGRSLVSALAVLPYLTDTMAVSLGLCGRGALANLGGRTALVHEQGGGWHLQETARAALLGSIEPSAADDLRARAATCLRTTDGPAAIDLFLAVGRFEDAADVLSEHLSEIGVRRAVHWLYQLPPDLRHRFPPVLALGRSSVNLVFAVQEATRRVETAGSEPVRREALLGLGSAQAHAGLLSASARSLEAAVAPGAPETVARRGMAWLGVVRWWAGDLTGAEAALAQTEVDAFSAWALGEVALARSDLGEARRRGEMSASAAEEGATADAGPVSGSEPGLEHGLEPGSALGAGPGSGDAGPAFGLSLLARVALAEGDQGAAGALAERAYRSGVEAGGLDLAVGAAPHAWVLAANGRLDEARAVADTIRRQVGRYDAYAQVHVALIDMAVAAGRGDAAELRTAEARLRDLRQSGFAPIEAQARWLIAALADSDRHELRVLLLGPCLIEVGGTQLRRSDWKSQKALEVLRFLALAGDRGSGREEVIEAVWPERDPEKGRTLLRTALAEIRRMLEPGRPKGEPSRFLTARADRLHLDAWTDLAQAERLAAAQPAEALALFRGAFFDDDPYVEWAEERRWGADGLRVSLAKHVAADDTAAVDVRRSALSLLVQVEPWEPDHAARLSRLASGPPTTTG